MFINRSRRPVAGVLVAILIGGLFLAFWLRPVRPTARDLQDLAGDAGPILSSLPHVVAMTQAGPSRPTIRIIHLLDYHLIAEDLHRLDAKNGQTYSQHLAQVETVQEEMESLLAALAKQHGVKQTLVEGLTPTGMKAWLARLDLLRSMAANDADLRRNLATAEKSGRPDLAGEARQLLDQARRERPKMGAVGLVASKGLLEALPLDNDQTLDAADPRGQGGIEAKRARDKAIVQRALAAAGPVAVIVLGGGHDLAREIQRQSNGKAEYLRVMLTAYRKADNDAR